MRRAAAVLAAGLFTAALMEGALHGHYRWAACFWRWTPCPQELIACPIYVPDPHTGWRVRPNATLPTRPIAYQTSSEGARALPLPANDGTRLLALGDSFTFGWGVPAEAHYAVVLEARLRAAGRSHQVRAVGVPSWGLEHEVRWLEAEGLAWRPRVIVVQFYPFDWDITDGLRPVQGYLVAEVSTDAEVFMRSWCLLCDAALSGYTAARVHVGAALRRTEVGAAMLARPTPPSAEVRAEQALERIHTHARAISARVLVVIVPHVTWLAQEAPRQREVAALCDRRGWSCVDLAPALRRTGRQTYLADDPHWSAEGHRVAGEEIARRVVPF